MFHKLIFSISLQVPAMKCKIETRVVVKTKPETKCKRVPKEFCKKQPCTRPSDKNGKSRDDDSGCYFMEKTVSSLIENIQNISSLTIRL